MAGVNPYAAASETPAVLRQDSFQHPAQLTSQPIRIHAQSLALPRSAPLVSDKLYSGFVEHLGRGIYGGILDDPKKPSPDSILEKQDKGNERARGRLAWRKDVVKILAKDGELEMPILR